MPTLVRFAEAITGVNQDPDQYRKTLEGLLASAGTMSGASETAMIQALDEARAQVQTVIGQLAIDSPTRALFEQARDGIDTAMANLADTMNSTIADYQAQGLALGVDIAIKPVGGDRGFDVLTNAITQDQLQILSSYSANLVQGLTGDLSRRINGEIAAVIIGAKSPYAASVAIGKKLTDPNHFSSIAHRARAIVVTEIGRAQALGTQAGQQALQASLKAGGFPDQVRKRPINAHLPGARPTHLAAEARYHPDGETGPIPVGDYYEIGAYKALYMRDPSLPASESVHCHCVSITVIGEGPDPLAEPQDKAQAAGAYTAAKAEAAAPAEIATKKHILGKKAATFLEDPYTKAGLQPLEPLKTGEPGFGGDPMAKALGYADPKDSGFVWNKTLGGWQHPKAPTRKQLPAFEDLLPHEQAALMTNAGLGAPSQNSIFKHLGVAKPKAPPTYTTSKTAIPDDPKAIAPGDPRPPPTAALGESPTTAGSLEELWSSADGRALDPTVDRQAIIDKLREHEADLDAVNAAWAETATPEQLEAFRQYSGNSGTLNRWIRSGGTGDPPNRWQTYAAPLDEAITSYPNEQWQVTWRVAEPYGGRTKTDILDDMRARAAAGESMHTDGYFSTSNDPRDVADAAGDRTIVYEVYSRDRGAWIQPQSEFKFEREWLVGHGVEFDVLGVTEVNYGGVTREVITLRERT